MSKLENTIVRMAKVFGSATGAFVKAREQYLRKPEFIAGLSQASSWNGGDIGNMQSSQLRAARNSWIYTGINKKALDLSASKMSVYHNPTGMEEDGVLAEAHSFPLVLKRPNPYMGRSLLFQYTQWWLDLQGEAFWFIEPGMFNGVKGVKGIWALPSNVMDIEFSDDYKSIKHYVAKLNQWYNIDPNYICHFKYPNPWDFFRGLSPLVALMLTVDADLAMKMWNGSFFGQDNVMPSAIISLGTGDSNNLFEQGDVDAIKGELESNYSAMRRKTVITNANTMSAALLGYNAKDMDFLAGMQWNKDEILLALGVPPSMVDKNATEANAKVGAKEFKENMWGIKNLIADEITAQILHMHYSDELEVRFEDDRIVDRQLELQEAALAKDALPREEWAKKYFGYELKPGQVTLSEGKMQQQQQEQDGNNQEDNEKKPKGNSFASNTVPSNEDVSKKHYGPGKHESGSDQDVHGNKGFTKELMETVGSEHPIDKRSIVISEGDEVLGTIQIREGWEIDGKESMYFNVHVAESDRRKGYGTKIISKIKELADKNNIVLYGSISAFGNGKKMSNKQLTKWYESQGFVIGDKPGMYGNVYYFPKQQTVIRINRKPKKSIELEDEFETLFRKARNSFKTKGHANIKFNPEFLDEELVKSILDDLSACETKEDIGTVYWQHEKHINPKGNLSVDEATEDNHQKSIGSWRPWSGFEDSLAQAILSSLKRILDILLNEASDTMHQDSNLWVAITNELVKSMMPSFEKITEKAVSDVKKILDKTAVNVSWDLINSKAKEWALLHAAQQIKNINETTKNAVQKAIGEWIANGRDNGIQGLRDRLQALTGEDGVLLFDEERAKRIARTEATSIYAGATEMALVENGYPKTVFKPIAHVNCRCYIQPGRFSNGEKVIIWYTARDEMVCKKEIDTPFGLIKGCSELHRTIISEGRAGQKWNENTWNPES